MEKYHLRGLIARAYEGVVADWACQLSELVLCRRFTLHRRFLRNQSFIHNLQLNTYCSEISRPVSSSWDTRRARNPRSTRARVSSPPPVRRNASEGTLTSTASSGAAVTNSGVTLARRAERGMPFAEADAPGARRCAAPRRRTAGGARRGRRRAPRRSLRSSATTSPATGSRSAAAEEEAKAKVWRS